MENSSGIKTQPTMDLKTILEQADKDITLSINLWGSSWSDPLWQAFSSRNLWIPLYLAVIVFFFYKFGWKKALVFILACILTVALCDQLGNLCKEHFQRLRPCWDEWMTSKGLRLAEGKGNLYGFYSAHAANSMGFAVCSASCIRHIIASKSRYYTYPIIIWALLVGTSRIFVGKHFLGDVLVGLCVGALLGGLISWAAIRISDRIRPASNGSS